MLRYRAPQPQLSAPLDALDHTAVAYLTLPLSIFLIGWFQWWAALPLIACLVVSLWPLLGTATLAPVSKGVAWRTGGERRLPARASLRGDKPELPTVERSSVGTRVPVTALQLTVAVVAGCAWTVLSGADHLLFANSDRYIRDVVLHDLVASPWPVGYGLLDGKESILRAPMAFYLPAALVGKGLGLAAAHIALGLWTAMGATLFLLQVLSLTPSRWGTALLVIAVVTLFSGLDIVGSLSVDGPRFRSDWNITTFLELWAGKYQYWSMTTQLFWAPNHALGGWLSIGLLCRQPRSDRLNLLLPVIVVAVALWSPLTALGLVPFVLLRVLSDSVREGSWRLMLPQVWTPAVAIGLLISAYLSLDIGGIPKGWMVGGNDYSFIIDLLGQAIFFSLEAGIIGGVVLDLRGSRQVALALVILALLPLAYFGPGNDLVAYASIPSLAMLAIGASLALVEPASESDGGLKKAVLAGLLLVGAVTPIAEIARAMLMPSWPINMSATLIGANCGGYPPHYIARLGGNAIDGLLRKTHRLPLGPQGPEACRNPATELMLKWSFKRR